MKYRKMAYLCLMLICGMLAGCSSDKETEPVSFRREAVSDEAEYQLDESMTMPEGVYIEDIYVGGRTVADVRTELEAAYEQAGSQKATVYWQVNPVETNLAELGLYWNIDDGLLRASTLGRQGSLIRQFKFQRDLNGGEYHVEIEKRLTQSAVDNFLQDYVSEVYDIEPVSATIEHTGNGFEVSEDVNGTCVNMEATWKLLQTSYADTEGVEPLVVQAVVDVAYPHYPTAELEKIHDLLGSSYTNYEKPSRNTPTRAINVEVATRNINGAVLMPGDTASTSELMKPRTEENGYSLGGVQVNGVIEDAVGGGICQASTTLYNALLKAELQIDERYNHSMKVSYVDPSKDAAISDSKDLVFTNNTDAPVYIEGYTDGDNVYFMIYGVETRPENREVKFESTTTYEQKYEEGGVEIDSYLEKVIYIDGEEVSREVLHKDHYEPSSRLNGTIN